VNDLIPLNSNAIDQLVYLQMAKFTFTEDRYANIFNADNVEAWSFKDSNSSFTWAANATFNRVNDDFCSKSGTTLFDDISCKAPKVAVSFPISTQGYEYFLPSTYVQPNLTVDLWFKRTVSDQVLAANTLFANYEYPSDAQLMKVELQNAQAYCHYREDWVMLNQFIATDSWYHIGCTVSERLLTIILYEAKTDQSFT
jgi:hypothetical protein